MSTTGLINVPSGLISQHTKSKTLIFDRRRRGLAISEPKYGSCFPASNLSGGRRDRDRKMGLVVYSSVEPGAPLPSEPPPNSWKSWILGGLITIILPFLRNKWGPLFKLTKEVESVVESVENVTEAIEKVAEEVEKVTEEVADELPEGGKLRGAIESVEKAAKKAVKEAHLAEDIINKVQEVEKEVEASMEPVNDQAIRTTEEATDQK